MGVGRLRAGFGLLGGAAGAAIGGLGVLKFGLDSIAEARDSIRTTRDTRAVIKSMGGVANVSANQVGNLANQLSLMSGIDDETIQGGENLLLTFGNIRNEVGKGNDVFDQASKSALDMSVRFGQDLKSSAIQLGKALNDPVKGVTALQRIGVQFTTSQRDQIKTLVATGHTLKAQKVILGEVRRETHGAAAAAADPLKKANQAWKQLEETLGKAILPVVSQAASAFARFTGQMLSGQGAGGRFARQMQDIGRTIGTVATFLWQHRKAVIAVVAAYAGYRIVARGIRAVRAAIDGVRKAVTVLRTLRTFGSAGLSASQLFASRFARGLKGGLLGFAGLMRTGIQAVLNPAATASGLAAAGRSAAGMARGLPRALGSKAAGFRGVLTAFGARIGPALGVAIAAAAAPKLLSKLKEQIQSIKDILGGDKEGIANESAKLLRPGASAPGGGGLDAILGALGFAGGGVVPSSSRVQVVGELGPELVRLPGGTRVTPAAQTAQVLAGRPVVLHSHVHLDGREIHRSVSRVEANLKARA